MKILLKVSSLLAIFVGVVMIAGGIWAISFTNKSVVQENITTPDDASIPNALVRGPFTLKSQADIIRKHVLETTNGLTFAEMPRTDEGRSLWVTATTLITALNLAIFAYLFSGLVLVSGLALLLFGFVFYDLQRRF